MGVSHHEQCRIVCASVRVSVFDSRKFSPFVDNRHSRSGCLFFITPIYVGGILIPFPALIDTDGTTEFPEQCGVILLAFQSQVGILTIQQVTVCPSNRLKVRGIYAFAAFVSPPQGDVARESVTLLNATPEPIDLR